MFRKGFEPYFNASVVRKMVDISKPPIKREVLESEGIKKRLVDFYFTHYQWQLNKRK
jgi:hypothetical protein